MTLKGRSALFWGVKKLALDWTSVLARPFTFCSLPGLEHGVSAKGRKRGRGRRELTALTESVRLLSEALPPWCSVSNIIWGNSLK